MASSVLCRVHPLLYTARPLFLESNLVGNLRSAVLIPSRCAAVKPTKSAGKKGAAPVPIKKTLEVESDPVKLTTYCCGANIYKTGEDPQLKPDSEYPEWLWKLNISGPKPLDELDPDTFYFWRRVRTAYIRRKNKLESGIL